MKHTGDSTVLHSILCPGTCYNASSISSIAVPETPSPGEFIHSKARDSKYAISVMETPDDDVNTENYSNEFEELPPLIRRKPSLLQRLPSDDSDNDDSFLDITADHDIGKNKNKSLHRKAEKCRNSDLETQLMEDGNHAEDKYSRSHFFSKRKSRRKSIAETLTPFDLNNDELISKKMGCYKDSGNRSKRRSASCSGSPSILKKSVNLTPGTGRRKSVSFSVSCSEMSPNINSKRNNVHIDNNNVQPVTVAVTPKQVRQRTILFEADNMLLTPVLKSSQILLRQSCGNNLGNQSPRNDNLPTVIEESSSVDQRMLSFQNFGTPPKQHKLDTTSKRQSGFCNNTVTSMNEQDKLNHSIMDTQPAACAVLEGVVAYVDVRVGNDNRSQAVKEQLLSLGAQIQEKLTSDVTHVIFRDGARGCFNKAKKRGLHIVSSLWVEACRENLTKAPESMYPSTSTEKYQSPALPHRLRKLKSMQPREFHEEELIAENRLRKRAKTQECDSPILELPNLFKTPLRNKEAKDSPLYGISHLLSPRQKHKSPDTNECNTEDLMLGSQPLNLEKSLARRLYDRYVSPCNMKDMPTNQQLPLPESHQTSDIEVTNISEACNTLSLQESEQFDKNKAEEKKKLSRCNSNPTKRFSLGNENRKKQVQTRRMSARLRRPKENSDIFISEEPESQGNTSGNELIHPDSHDGTDSSSSSLQLALSENGDECEPTKDKNYKLGKENPEALCSTLNKDQVTIDEEETERNPAVRRKNCKLLEESSIGQNNVHTQILPSMPSQGSQYSIVSPGGTRKIKRRLISIDSSRPPSEELIIPSSPMQVSNLRQPYADLMNNSSKTQKRSVESPRLSQFGKLPNSSLYTSTPLVKERTKRRNTLSALPQSSKKRSVSQRKPAVKKKVDTNSNSEGDDNDEVFINSHLFTLPPRSRRSTDEFQIINNKLTRKTKKKPPGVICITSFHSKENGAIISIVKKLGGFKVVDTVDACTSHIVCGAERRTMNVLNGIARGCWILDVSWVYHSLEMNGWVSEEPFEMFTFCQGAKVNREKRALQGRHYKNSLFSSAGNIYVTDNCTPPAPQLKELLELCGANLVKSTRSANIIIGKGAIGIDGKVKHLQEKWILDSIQKHNVESITTYLVT
ncbi:microcephalin [Oratosquilla oratoria]|uniref:microcephalin n=1 Tax=Oratosquilla oratoria TaxID=337810 RepID=UPI003F76779E